MVHQNDHKASARVCFYSSNPYSRLPTMATILKTDSKDMKFTI